MANGVEKTMIYMIFSISKMDSKMISIKNGSKL